MIEIDGKFYIIDMDKLMAWVAETPSSEKNINTITTMTYPITNDDEEEIVEKEISETKSTLNDAMNNIRYDFVRILINTILTTFTTDLNQILSYDLKTMSFSQKLAFNTLLHKKIIIEVTNVSNE